MIGVLFAPAALDMPEFARNSDLSCAACRSAFPRLSFLDYIPYRMAGISFERGRSFGLMNGNSVREHFDINSPGLPLPRQAVR